MVVLPVPPFGEYTAMTTPCPSRFASFDPPSAVASSFAPPGSTNTASMPSSGRGSTGRCGTVTTMIRVPGDAARIRLATSNPVTLP